MDFNGEKVNGLAKALVGRVELLEELFKIKKSELTYSQIQRIAKSGYASEFFDLGDEIMTTYTATDGTEYDFPWRIVDFRDVYWENDDTPHPGMVLQSKYSTIEEVTYDAREGVTVDPTETEALEGWYYFGKTGNKMTRLDLNPGDAIPHGEYNSIVKNDLKAVANVSFGNNSYKFSEIRQWLNSDAEKDNWWTSQHPGDSPSAYASTYNSFIYGLSKEFIDIINAVQIKTNEDIVYDKMFLPSSVSMNGQQHGIADVCFGYWKKASDNSEPHDRPVEWRKINNISNKETIFSYWLRDNADRGGYQRFVYTDGSISPGIAVSGTCHVAPCCVIS